MTAVLTALACGLVLGTAGAVSPGPAPLLEDVRRAGEGPTITELTPPPRVTARGWLVHDATSDEPIAGVEANTSRPIASLAKLMTAHVVVERLDLETQVTIPAAVNELGADAARMDARAGERWPARELLQAMLVTSANDAALALALEVGDGDEGAFVDLMNAEAEELGLTETSFASSTGLDTRGAASTSTPTDLVALAEAVLEDEDVAAAVAEPSLTLTRPGSGEEILVTNRNPLLDSYPGVDGVKTGFTDEAGYMLVTHHVDEETDGELFVATFASRTEASRIADARSLLDWARPLRSELLVAEAGTPLASVPVQHEGRSVDVFVCDDLFVTARVGQGLEQQVVLPRSLAAPVQEGDEVGELRVGVRDSRGEEPLAATVSLCAADTVRRRSRGERLTDQVQDYRSAWRTGIDGVEDGVSSVRELVA